MEKTGYGIRKELTLPYEEVVAKVRKALAEEGFGVLTEIDVKETLRKKLDVDFRRYIILGACNPPFAYQSLQAERDIGLLLPCNVIVYEDDKGQAVVAAIDPEAAMGMIDNPQLTAIASQIREKLERVIEKV
ncbi:DUF302 domain-containing protein [candidate division KSB1 bacterium]|nr:DUF302 domain-containing protein [candidate division KSB1 bacterium]